MATTYLCWFGSGVDTGANIGSIAIVGSGIGVVATTISVGVGSGVDTGANIGSIAIVGSGIGVVATNISIGVGSGVDTGTDIGLTHYRRFRRWYCCRSSNSWLRSMSR